MVERTPFEVVQRRRSRMDIQHHSMPRIPPRVEVGENLVRDKADTPISPAVRSQIERRKKLVVIKLEGESRPYPMFHTVLDIVVPKLTEGGKTIDGIVRTGPNWYQIRTNEESDTEGVVLKLQGMSIQEWPVSARKVDRGPLYIALNVPFSISNEQVEEEMGKYGEVKEVREQEYRKWPGQVDTARDKLIPRKLVRQSRGDTKEEDVICHHSAHCRQILSINTPLSSPSKFPNNLTCGSACVCGKHMGLFSFV